MVQFRQDAGNVLQRLRRGEAFILTYRGEPVARMSPCKPGVPRKDDPMYRLTDFAVSEGESLTNSEIDEIVYGQ